MTESGAQFEKLEEITEKDMDGEGDNDLIEMLEGCPCLWNIYEKCYYSTCLRHERRGFKKFQGLSILVWWT